MITLLLANIVTMEHNNEIIRNIVITLTTFRNYYLYVQSLVGRRKCRNKRVKHVKIKNDAHLFSRLRGDFMRSKITKS